MRISILPSMLAADYGSLREEALRAVNSGADALHLDIMDGSFVPNISFGPAIVKMCAKTVKIPLNVHLMLQHPERYLDVYAQAGATTLQVHVEASCDISAALRRIHELGCQAGLVLNPQTPASAAAQYLGQIDEVLVMSVYPGFGGQKFMPCALESVRALRAAAPSLPIMVDGGISRDTISLATQSGANCFVAGSALFGAADMQSEIALLRKLAGATRR